MVRPHDQSFVRIAYNCLDLYVFRDVNCFERSSGMHAVGRLSRRSLIQVGAVGLSGLTLPALLAAEPSEKPFAPLPATHPRAKACILIYLDGGPSHIDLFDIRPEAPADIRGPFQPIATTVAGTMVCEHLPLIAR